MARRRKKLGDILVSWGLIKQADLDRAAEYAQKSRRKLGEALIEMQLVSEEDVTKALATQFDLEYVDLDKNAIPVSSLRLIPTDIIKRHKILPVSQENGRLKVVIHDPLDLETQDLLRFRLNVELDTALAPKSKIERFIDQFVSETKRSIDETMDELKRELPEDQDALQGGRVEDADAPIIRLLNLIIDEAVRTRASDIHIEPMSDRVRVRYRIDGICLDRDSIPKSMQGPVTARLKIMAGTDIAERRLPQDGRIKRKIDGSDIDFRVSFLPAYHGESVVLRILRPESVRIGIRSLGFEEEDYQQFIKIIKRPNGIFLVTGPTGSGKTTTLYAALQELNRPDKKLVTAEDPVEYNFTGINQCQVREDIGLTFASVLRSMLRQSPDIILVGEIRDKETAEIAIQAALTGHLVFSTLHTNDAPSAITRLIDMGAKPFLVASSVQAIMAQRLIRVLCAECKQPDPAPDRFLLRLVGITDDQAASQTIYKPVGCKVCHGTGFRGRLGIFEMMTMNNEIRELAFNRAPTGQLRRAAKAAGMKPLVADGRIKILKGITTPAEVARVTQAEGVIVD
jgi:type IV pilus assembly protein PilB